MPRHRMIYMPVLNRKDVWKLLISLAKILYHGRIYVHNNRIHDGFLIHNVQKSAAK